MLKKLKKTEKYIFKKMLTKLNSKEKNITIAMLTN